PCPALAEAVSHAIVAWKTVDPIGWPNVGPTGVEFEHMQNRRMNMYRLELDLEGYDPKGWRAAIRREPRPLYIRGKRCLRDIRSGRASRACLYSPMLHDTHKRDGGNPVTRSPLAIPARPRQPASAPSRARATIDAMDQPTPTPKAQDSTLLVTMTAAQLR